MATVTPPSTETPATTAHSVEQGGPPAKPKPRTLEQIRPSVEEFILFVITRSATLNLHIDRLCMLRAELGHQLEAAADTVKLSAQEFNEYLREDVYHGRLYLTETLTRLRCLSLLNYACSRTIDGIGKITTLFQVRQNFAAVVGAARISLSRNEFDDYVPSFKYKDHEGLVKAIGHLKAAQPTK